MKAKSKIGEIFGKNHDNFIPRQIHFLKKIKRQKSKTNSISWIIIS